MLPPLSKALGLSVLPVGGWMISSLNTIKEFNSNIVYAVATIWYHNEFKVVDVGGIRYFLLPGKIKSPHKYDKNLEPYWKQIADEFQPDVVHVHGTEFPYGLAYINANGARGVVVSMQGIISGFARYYTAGIDYKSAKRCLTFRDLVKHDSILKQQKKFEKRGELEATVIKSVNHIIGRTEWDKAHVNAINPNVRYHYCGETLRSSFYINKWNYDSCEPHSIFISQAGYPIKGLHMLLKAMPHILEEFPDTKIYIAGRNIIDEPIYRISGYAKILKKLIKKNNLADKLIFTGPLDEESMCSRYLKSNVFVCPSSIENSPNSLGEAQLLGMPYVVSFVGGVPEIVNYNSDSLYRFEEFEMLAMKICRLFRMKYNYTPVDYDSTRYDGNINSRLLLDIYHTIMNSDK